MPHLPNGVYRITQWGSDELPQILTLQGELTVFPPGETADKYLEWRLENLPNGKVAIQNPSEIFPSHSLSYNGEPERGKMIIAGPPSDFPTREWYIETATQKQPPVPYFIRVPDKDLIVEISPIFTFPPQLILGPTTNDLEKAWVFERIRD